MRYVGCLLRLLVFFSLAACVPSRPTRRPESAAAPVVALISASSEWKALIGLLPEPSVQDTPYGPWLVHRLGGRDVVFFHGGYGKVSAAGSTQYAIGRWHPILLINLGTCGGFGDAKVGEVFLANQTVIYDLIEAMGNPDETIADYSTHLDTSAWPENLRSRVRFGPLVSADRDLIPAELPRLTSRYHASAGDWESGAIAWVAARPTLVHVRPASIDL